MTPVTHLTGGRSRSRGQKPGRPHAPPWSSNPTLLFEASALVLLCPLPVSQTSHRERSALCLWAVARRGASSPHASRLTPRTEASVRHLPPQAQAAAPSPARELKSQSRTQEAEAPRGRRQRLRRLPTHSTPSLPQPKQHPVSISQAQKSESGRIGEWLRRRRNAGRYVSRPELLRSFVLSCVRSWMGSCMAPFAASFLFFSFGNSGGTVPFSFLYIWKLQHHPLFFFSKLGARSIGSCIVALSCLLVAPHFQWDHPSTKSLSWLALHLCVVALIAG